MATLRDLVIRKGTPGYQEVATVQIASDGNVYRHGAHLGRVYKGTRTWSPPLYPGSRVVKFHREVPCWYADIPDQPRWGRYRPDFRTRQDGIWYLIRKHEEAQS